MQSNSKADSNSALVKSGSKLSVLVLISRILGLIRQMTMSSFLGTGPLADAFTTAFMLPNLFRRLFAENSIAVAFIPTFNDCLENYKTAKDKSAAKRELSDFLNAVFTLVSFSTVCVVLLGIVFAPLIIKYFFKGLADYDSTVFLTRIMFPYLFLISLAAFFQGILNGIKVFMPSGVTPILFNILVITCTYIFSKPFGNPAVAMAYGVLLGGFVQAVFQLPFVLKANFIFKPVHLKNALRNSGMKKVLRLITPTIVGIAAYQINDVVSTSFAADSGLGIASSLQYSLRLQELLLGIFAVSIGTVILPDLSSLAAKKEWQAFQNLLLNSIKIIALITIPATFFSLCTGEHIITLIYKSRKFDETSVALTFGIFQFHIAGLFAIAVNRIIAPAFYALNDSKSPTLAGIICFGVNIFAAYILKNFMGGNGLALALTLASFINTVILFIFLRRNKNLNMLNLVVQSTRFIVKICIFSVIASLPLYFIGEKLYAPFSRFGKIIAQGFPLFVSFILFAAIGIALLFVSKDQTVSVILQRFPKKKNFLGSKVFLSEK